MTLCAVLSKHTHLTSMYAVSLCISDFSLLLLQYHKSVETGVTIPILSLGDELDKLSLGNRRVRTANDADPAAEASKRGKVPTLGEMQKSLRVRICGYLIGNRQICSSNSIIRTAINQDTYSNNIQYGDASK